MRLNYKNIKIISFFLIILISPFILEAQYHNTYKQKVGFRDGWSVNFNIGLTSFFGDLSVFDFHIVKKISNESKFGGGIIFAKEISPVISFNTQFLYGGLKGTKESSNIYFKANIIEGSLNGQINIIQIFFPQNKYRKINILGNFGIGLVSIKSKLFNLKTDSLIHSFGFGRKTIESILKIGFKINYRISEQYDLVTNFSNRRVDTDKLDSQPGNNNKDFYSYVSIGITYKFQNNSKNGFKHKRYKKPFKHKYPQKKRLKRKVKRK